MRTIVILFYILLIALISLGQKKVQFYDTNTSTIQQIQNDESNVERTDSLLYSNKDLVQSFYDFQSSIVSDINTANLKSH